jgi:hypothetical protein
MNRILIGGIMPALFATVSLATAAPVSSNELAPFPRDLPARCAPLAQVPTSATIPGPARAAHVSVANCIADIAMNALILTPDDVSISRLNAALAPSMALLDSVISTGDPYWIVVAQGAKRDLYVGMIARERASLVNADPHVRNALEVGLTPWRNEASRATVAIIELGRSDPELGNRDPVIAAVISRAIDERGAQVAGRSH